MSYHREKTHCANGASDYLFYGGIVIISANVAGILAGCARQLALKVRLPSNNLFIAAQKEHHFVPLGLGLS